MEDTAKKLVITKKYAKGEVLMAKGQPLSQMAVIISGTAAGRCGAVNVFLQPGAVIGLMDIQSESYVMEYTALEEVTLCLFMGKTLQDLKKVFEQDDTYSQMIVDGCKKEMDQLINAYNMEKILMDQVSKYVKKQYARYGELCQKIGTVPVQSTKLEQVEPKEASLGNVEMVKQYFMELGRVPADTLQAFFGAGDMLIMHHLEEMSKMTLPLLKGCEMQLSGLNEILGCLCGQDNENVFMLYMQILKSQEPGSEVVSELLGAMKEMVDLYEKIEQSVVQKLHLQMAMTASKYKALLDNVEGVYKKAMVKDDGGAVNGNLVQEVSGMLNRLLEFSGLEQEVVQEFKDVLKTFCEMPDRLSTENDARTIRKKLTGLFYKLYRKVFFRAEDENRNDVFINLFLNYGIVDETMFQMSTLETLVAGAVDEEEYPIKVYTIRQWLHEIYMGNKEPSRNEFDQDYQEYLREQTKSRVDISKQELERLNSPKEKVKFEIKNFFTMNNRLTSGHLLTFCPVLTEEDLGENFKNQIITPKMVNKAFKQVLSIDFSVFYRDVLYDDPSNGINKLTIHQEVMPDVICMPNAGTMGRMWQEISGRKRASAGRFTLPIVLKEDIRKVTIRMIGSFRWEICKRVQGNYWNDVSEPSLTSEFCDYIQFYKKNRDLSEKTKEKIAQMLVKCRNNYGEVFVSNYMVWVASESAGNVRLDKVTRNILGRYCPFVKSIRDKLAEQPMFTEAISRYERERAKRVKELSNRRAAIRNCNGTETEEFLSELEYVEL